MKKPTNSKKPLNKPSKGEMEHEKDLKKLGNRIKQLRIKKGYSSYEVFAFENGISRAQFGRYERGEDLRYSSLLKVVKALGISVKDFFSDGF
jgi:transcriptional regulator with XRE-family HTH domain